MKILITGNCGFIGQNFVRLFKDKYEIIGIDKMGYASDRNAIKLCKHYITDIVNKENVFKILEKEKPDILIHNGAESHVDNSINSPESFIYSNYVGTFNLLEGARLNNIKRFLFIDTDEVYGDLNFNEPPFSNKHLLKPSSPYSASKAAASLLVLAYHRTYGLNVSITRTCNNYGPYQYKEKFLPVVIKNALENKPIPIYGRGKNIREWIYVEDNCRAIEAVMLYGKNGEIYHIGTGKEISNIEMVKKILGIMGRSESLINFVVDRKGHDLRYALDCCLYLKKFWSPEISLEMGLIKTINWVKENPNYWEDM